MYSVASRLGNGFLALTGAPSSPIRNVSAVVSLATCVISMIPPDLIAKFVPFTARDSSDGVAYPLQGEVGDESIGDDEIKLISNLSQFSLLGSLLTNRLVVSAISSVANSTIMRVPQIASKLGSTRVQTVIASAVGVARLASFVASCMLTLGVADIFIKVKNNEGIAPNVVKFNIDGDNSHDWSIYQRGLLAAVTSVTSSIIPNVGRLLVGLVR
ncbi:MAG: hypothetical protein P0S95_05015 [Rhabdochlamydiaceae bacterium]|nr:hypothetical protein [Candidatus Amphrikana amoebophyrae]